MLRGGPSVGAPTFPTTPELMANIERAPEVMREPIALPVAPPDTVHASRTHDRYTEQQGPQHPVRPQSTRVGASVHRGAPAAEVPGSRKPTATANASGVADPTYYGVRQLDVFPAPLAPIQIGFPPAAHDRASSGRVHLLLLIDETGRVAEITVIEAEPPGLFEEAARSAFASMQFSPAERAGRRVRARLVVEVNFGGP